jgi:hypothetical protein
METRGRWVDMTYPDIRTALMDHYTARARTTNEKCPGRPPSLKRASGPLESCEPRCGQPPSIPPSERDLTTQRRGESPSRQPPAAPRPSAKPPTVFAGPRPVTIGQLPIVPYDGDRLLAAVA